MKRVFKYDYYVSHEALAEFANSSPYITVVSVALSQENYWIVFYYEDVPLYNL